MIKPTMPNIPGIGAMTDTLDFVKNLWGGMSIPGMGVPGMVMPTLSVDEINKQISDLKAVEAWLTLNMNMLRATIQALEVQSATISNLKSMGESFRAAVKPGAGPAATRPKDADPFSKAAGKADAAPPPQASETGGAPAGAPRSEAAGSPAAAGNPALWWTMLQDQFKQAVTAAMASEKSTAAPAAAKTKPATAPRKRKAAPGKT